MGSAEVNAFLSPLVVDLYIRSSTQNLIFWALMFLYQELLECELAPEVLVRADISRLPATVKHHAGWGGQETDSA